MAVVAETQKERTHKKKEAIFLAVHWLVVPSDFTLQWNLCFDENGTTRPSIIPGEIFSKPFQFFMQSKALHCPLTGSWRSCIMNIYNIKGALSRKMDLLESFIYKINCKTIVQVLPTQDYF